MHRSRRIYFVCFLLVTIVSFWLPSSAFAAGSADLNNDKTVNLFDYNILLANFGKTGNAGFIAADIDANGKVNIFDYNALIANFGKSITTPTPAPDRPLVGVRHFPSHPSSNHQVRNAHEQLLGSGGLLTPPQDWHDRWPYFTIVRSANTIDVHEDDQRVIDQEIQLTAASGIDYWAIEADWINTDSEYNYALNLYKSSPYKNQLKYALIVVASPLTTADWQGTYLTRIISSFQDPQYVTVKDGRPLLYMWNFSNLVTTLGKTTAQQRMKDFIGKVKAAIGKEPYIVMMDLGSQNELNTAQDFSAAARTSYLGAFTSCRSGGPYSSLAQDNLNQWNSFKNSNLNYIPLVTIGMDPRPKSLDTELFEFGGSPIWCKQGSPQEIANNVKAAIGWVKANRQVTSGANTVLLAAWIDINESGWLVPTLGEGNARLNAISEILGGHKMNVPTSPYATNPPASHPKGTVTELSVTDGATLPADTPISISGRAPMAVRLTMRLQGAGHISEKFFMNGKGTLASRKFTVELPALPPGGPYTLTITGVDGEVGFVKVANIQIK